MSVKIRETVTDGLYEKLMEYQAKARASKLSGIFEQMVAHCQKTGFLEGMQPVEGTSEGTMFSDKGEDGEDES